MICDTCESEYGDLSQNVGTCPECLAVIIAHAVPDDEEDDRECTVCGQLMRYDPLKNSEVCLDCAYDEPGEPHEPEEGDWFTADYVTFHEWEGKDLFIAGDDWQKSLKQHMDAEKYWPNVWLISDHGNCHLLQMEAPDYDYVRDRSDK